MVKMKKYLWFDEEVTLTCGRMGLHPASGRQGHPLVELVVLEGGGRLLALVAMEEGTQRQQLAKNAAKSPYVHSCRVVLRPQE